MTGLTVNQTEGFSAWPNCDLQASAACSVSVTVPCLRKVIKTVSEATDLTVGEVSEGVKQAADASLSVRAIVASDGDNYRSIMQRTSVEDRYCRFFHVVNHFDCDAMERYTEARPDTIGLIAEKHGRPLGVAHAVFIDEGHAEIAIVVANDARQLGVGKLLFEQILGALERRGPVSLTAYALIHNVAFSHLARAAGMRPGLSDGGIVTWTLSSRLVDAITAKTV